MFEKSKKKESVKLIKERLNTNNKKESKKEVKDELIITNIGANRKKEVKRKNKGFSLKSLIIISSILLFLLIVIYGISYINFNITEKLWKVSLTVNSDFVNNKSIQYCGFENGMMRISNDGITYVDTNGIVKWTISYNMKDPIFSKKDKLFSIADRHGSLFYIFDEEGLLGSGTSNYQIDDVALSNSGILYLLQSDSNNSYIYSYNSEGQQLTNQISGNITTNGMPLNISTSNDGSEVLLAMTKILDNNICSKASYYNFNGITDNKDFLIKEIEEELQGKFLARVHFFDNERSFLLYDDGIIFVSTSDPTNPTIIKKIDLKNKINSISYDNDNLVITLDDGKYVVYGKNGEVICNKSYDSNYDKFYIDNNCIVFIYGEHVKIYDVHGKSILDRVIEDGVQYVAKKDSLFFSDLIIGLVDGVECIRCF